MEQNKSPVIVQDFLPFPLPIFPSSPFQPLSDFPDFKLDTGIREKGWRQDKTRGIIRGKGGKKGGKDFSPFGALTMSPPSTFLLFLLPPSS